MNSFTRNWLQPLLYLGKNKVSLLGAAITSAAALTLIGFWVVDVLGHGGSTNPYIGIIVLLILPALFVFGLILIPIGIWFHRKSLKATGQLPADYPRIDLADPFFRRAANFVIIATLVNFFIVSVASYRGVAYMDKATFCGTSCHVMAPEWAAYQVAPHSHVACVDCHIGSGASSYVKAKVNGTKQLYEVAFHRYPRPIPAPVWNLRPAKQICEPCHTPAHYVGEKLVVRSSFADDETNSQTRSLVLLHLGGQDSLSHLTGIHGAHLGHIEYIAGDASRQTIPWISKTNDNGSTTEYVSTDTKNAIHGERRLMDCIDCHNRAAHSLETPEDALNRAMVEGSPSASLPFIHQQGFQLIKASYTSQSDASARIASGIKTFYQSRYPQIYATQGDKINQAIHSLVAIYSRNVFPEMKVTWGTHPNNIGHNSYPGCFRCHDGSHNTAAGQTLTNDCSVCHNLLAVDEVKPKLLTDLGIQ